MVQKSMYFEFTEQIDCLLGEIKSRRIVVWGAGVRGLLVGYILESKGLLDFDYVDNSMEKQGKSVAGHEVKSIKDIDMENAVFIISVECQEMIKEQLNTLGLKENSDFFCLHSCDVDIWMNKIMKQIGRRLLISGGQNLPIVSMEELGAMSLEEQLEHCLGEKARVLGIPCLNMRTLYFLFKFEMETNPLCKMIVLLIDRKSMNSYNHLLPRTQKREFLENLKVYIEGRVSKEFVAEIDVAIRQAVERQENYQLENRYSPKRMHEGRKEECIEMSRNYVEECLLQSFDVESEEMIYLNRILRLAKSKTVRMVLISEPLNFSFYRQLVGKRFDEAYLERSRWLKEQAGLYGAEYYEMDELFSEKDFVLNMIATDALVEQSREKMKDFIVKVIENRRDICK